MAGKLIILAEKKAPMRRYRQKCLLFLIFFAETLGVLGGVKKSANEGFPLCLPLS